MKRKTLKLLCSLWIRPEIKLSESTSVLLLRLHIDSKLIGTITLMIFARKSRTNFLLRKFKTQITLEYLILNNKTLNGVFKLIWFYFLKTKHVNGSVIIFISKTKLYLIIVSYNCIS